MLACSHYCTQHFKSIVISWIQTHICVFGFVLMLACAREFMRICDDGYCRQNASVGLQCCPLLPVCLLVSSHHNGFTEVFSVGSLLAAIAVSLLAVINYIPSQHCLPAVAMLVLASVAWISRTAVLGSGICHFIYQTVLVAVVICLTADTSKYQYHHPTAFLSSCLDYYDSLLYGKGEDADIYYSIACLSNSVLPGGTFQSLK